jgi:hypothetical protein
MPRLRLSRLAAAALAAVAVVLVVPHAGDASVAAPARPAAAASAEATASAPAAQNAETTAATSTAASGPCSVPGIGDIGGLLGFCSAGSSGLLGDLNNICQPSLPDPEPASSGIDSMVAPPATGKQPVTLYGEYGVAGDYWAATNLQCSDMTSLIGNNVAGMVFDAAKSIDRVTITVYQSAAGEGILSWLQRVTDTLITGLGKAIYFPYLSVAVIIAAIWLAWQGLIRKRGTRTIEGTIWMVVACAAAIFLIGKPADVTGLGRGVSDGISQALNVAFAKLPSPGPSSCVPLQKSDPQVPPATYDYTSGNTVVDQNANELWTVLVCKPWLVGEFGTSVVSTNPATPTAVNTYGRALLWSQAIATNEKPTAALIQAKQAAYGGIASSIEANDPSVYPLFQGKQWTTRLEVAFAALFAALVAGVLVLLISVTLILLKLSFLLLLIVGPFFLLIGVHPGLGRVVALRWVEMLVGVLLKQAAVALVLSVLLYCYALIMGTSDAVLPWALKILMIALVTVAAFIYRKPFQHLFSAVGYGMIGSQERAQLDLSRAGSSARANTLAAATIAAPPFAAYRAGRWARRNPGQAASLAVAATSGGAGAAVAAGLQAGDPGSMAAADGTTADAAAVAAGTAADSTGGRMAAAARARGAEGLPAAAVAPPLNLPSRGAGGPAPAGPAPAAASGTAGTSVPGPVPGVWPGAVRNGNPANGPAGRQPAVAPPRPASPRAGGSGPAVPPQASRRAAAPRPAAPSSWSPPTAPASPPAAPAPDPGPQRQAPSLPAVSRPGPARRLRDRWPAAATPVRQSGAGAGRQGTAPARGTSPAPAPQPPGEARSAAEWPGQRPAGPATPAEQQAERTVPFWLRPMRRK